MTQQLSQRQREPEDDEDRDRCEVEAAPVIGGGEGPSGKTSSMRSTLGTLLSKPL
jgi:hypothetical protein